MQECIESTDFKLSEEQWSHIDEIIDTYGNKPGGLIPMLEKIQFYLGFLPVPVQERISEKTGIPESKIYGVVSFYSFFTMTPRGRHRIQVCMGTACYVKGGKKIVEKIEEEYGEKLRKLYQERQAETEKKQNEFYAQLDQAIFSKINEVTTKVAEQEGRPLVVVKKAVYYGGKDLTPQVLAMLKNSGEQGNE